MWNTGCSQASLCWYILNNIVTLAVSNMAFLVLPLLVIFSHICLSSLPSWEWTQPQGDTRPFLPAQHIWLWWSYFMVPFSSCMPNPSLRNLLGQDNLQAREELVSMFYGVVTPMLNPIIYSLRNKDVKAAVKYLLSQKSVNQLRPKWNVVLVYQDKTWH